jgi:hypothetical protein
MSLPERPQVTGLELAQQFRFGSPGYFLKFERACAHLQALADEGGLFVDHYLHPDGGELVQDGEWVVIKWGRVIPPPAWWTLYLGDFIHNLRGCLDHLIYQLVIANNCDPGAHTAFPICETEGQWKRNVDERRRQADRPPVTEGVSDLALGIVKLHQPLRHRTANARQNDPLMHLLRMSNTDKHRTIHVAAVHRGRVQRLRFVPRGYVRIVERRVPPAMGLVEKGAELVRMRVEDLQPSPPEVEVGVAYQVPAKLTFAAPGDTRLVTLDDLFAMLNAVRKIGEDLEVHVELAGSHFRDLGRGLEVLNKAMIEAQAGVVPVPPPQPPG